MGLLASIGEAIDHIKAKRETVNRLQNDYRKVTLDIGVEGDSFNKKLARLQEFSGYEYSLMMVMAIVRMNDSEYKEFLQEHFMKQPIEPTQPVGAKIFEGIAETAFIMRFVTPAVWKFGKTYVSPAYQKLRTRLRLKLRAGEPDESTRLLEDADATEMNEMGVTQEGDQLANRISSATRRTPGSSNFNLSEEGPGPGGEEEGGELGERPVPGSQAAADAPAAGSDAGLTQVEGAIADAPMTAFEAASGAVAIVAIGIDVIVSACEVADEQDKLNKEIDKLNKALKLVTKFRDKLKEKEAKIETMTIKHQKSFMKNMDALNAIVTAGFTYKFPTGTDKATTAKFTHAAQQAVTQYSYVQQVRQGFNRMKKNQGATFTWRGFKAGELAFRPPSLTEAQANGLIDYAVQHSEAMKAAKQAG